MATTYVRNENGQFELVGPGGATTDTTLSQVGKPADAAAVGSALTGYSLLSHGHTEYITHSIMRNLGAYNYLDNSDFTNLINQRGSTSYNSAGYSIDRWAISSGSTLTVNNGSITVTGSMIQCVAGLNSGDTYTFAYGNNANTFIGNVTYDSAKGYHRVSLPSGTWTWAALYKGEYTIDNLPYYIAKGYGVEIMECMRYYQRYFSVHFNPNYQYYVGSEKYTHFNSLLLTIPMRTSPDVSILAASLTNVGDKTAQTTMEVNSKCITPCVKYDGTVTIDKSLTINFELSSDLKV